MPALAFGCFLFSHSGYAQCPKVCDNNQNTGFGVAALPAVNGGTAKLRWGMMRSLAPPPAGKTLPWAKER